MKFVRKLSLYGNATLNTWYEKIFLTALIAIFFLSASILCALWQLSGTGV